MLNREFPEHLSFWIDAAILFMPGRREGWGRMVWLDLPTRPLKNFIPG